MRPGHESSSLRVKMPVPDAILSEACYRYNNMDINSIILDYLVGSLSRKLRTNETERFARVRRSSAVAVRLGRGLP